MSRDAGARWLTKQKGKIVKYLVCARSDQGIISQVTADIGGDDLPVDAIPGNEILVLSGVRRLRLGRRSHRRGLCRGNGPSRRHYDVGWGEDGLEMEGGEGMKEARLSDKSGWGGSEVLRTTDGREMEDGCGGVWRI